MTTKRRLPGFVWRYTDRCLVNSSYPCREKLETYPYNRYNKIVAIGNPINEGTVENMGMTNKQFQGFIRLALGWLEKALDESPDNKSLQTLKDIFQSMSEDD